MAHKYVLTSWKGGVFGVYSSLKKLKPAVDYWVDKCPKAILMYEVWTENHIPEPREHNFVYIPRGHRFSKSLRESGNSLPNRKLFGMNLTGLCWWDFNGKMVPELQKLDEWK